MLRPEAALRNAGGQTSASDTRFVAMPLAVITDSDLKLTPVLRGRLAPPSRQLHRSGLRMPRLSSGRSAEI